MEKDSRVSDAGFNFEEGVVAKVEMASEVFCRGGNGNLRAVREMDIGASAVEEGFAFRFVQLHSVFGAFVLNCADELVHVSGGVRKEDSVVRKENFIKVRTSNAFAVGVIRKRGADVCYKYCHEYDEEVGGEWAALANP